MLLSKHMSSLNGVCRQGQALCCLNLLGHAGWFFRASDSPGTSDAVDAKAPARF